MPQSHHKGGGMKGSMGTSAVKAECDRLERSPSAKQKSSTYYRKGKHKGKK